jgi:hypothetical protein
MPKTRPLYCATDKELFDALASSPQHFSEPTLLELAKKRGIFYSPLADRMQLCSDISLLGFVSMMFPRSKQNSKNRQGARRRLSKR